MKERSRMKKLSQALAIAGGGSVVQEPAYERQPQPVEQVAGKGDDHAPQDEQIGNDLARYGGYSRGPLVVAGDTPQH